jgi:eukaryotic-like serine/threonine-protein kinase
MMTTAWEGKVLGGRYEIGELLGQGGMSSVYKANDPNLRRSVAIKLIHPHLSNNPEFVRRFEEEAASVARLRHPNIIQVYDFNTDSGVYYMVMEYLAGETLGARLKRLNASR